MKKLYANFRHARVVKLLKVEVNEGEGTPENPTKRVAYYINPSNSEVLWHNDIEEREFAGENEMYKLTNN